MQPATWFLVLGLPIGLFLAFLIPPSQGLDEPNHFFRVYSISSGNLVDPMNGGRTGAVLPACVKDYALGLYSEGRQPVPFHLAEFLRAPAGCSSKPDIFQPFENTAIYSPVSYLPQVLGVSLGRRLGLSLPLVFYMGRLAGLLGFCALVYLALRLIPRGKAVLLAVALLPMSLTLAAEYSADGMTIALALLTIAGLVRCCVVDDATWRSFALTAAAAAALALSKDAYWLLAAMLLLVPARLFPSPAVSVAARFGALLAIAALSIAWYLQVRDVSIAAGMSPGVDAHSQLTFIFDHPSHFARTVAQTLVGAQAGYFAWTGFVSWIGFSRSAAAGTPQPPPIVVVIGYFLVVEGYRRSVLRPFTWSTATGLRALFPVAVVLATAVLIVAVGYVTASPVAAPWVWIQGRYFLPLAAVPLVSLVMLNRGRSDERSVEPMVPLVLLLAAYLLVKVPNYFY